MDIGNLRVQLLQRLHPFNAGADLPRHNQRLCIGIFDLGNKGALSDHGLERIYAISVIASHKLTERQYAASASVVWVRLYITRKRENGVRKLRSCERRPPPVIVESFERGIPRSCISTSRAARLSSDRAMKAKSHDSAAPERSYFSVERAAHRHPLRT
jgi:hypothetical protein